MGTAYGAIFMLQAIGMGLGAFGGGWLPLRFDAPAATVLRYPLT